MSSLGTFLWIFWNVFLCFFPQGTAQWAEQDMMCAGAKGKPELVHISTGLWTAEEGGSDFLSAKLLIIINEMGSSQIFPVLDFS